MYQSAPDSPAAVVFRHSTHVALMHNRCLECHPAPFKQLHPDYKGRHAEMNAGRGCGKCHNSKTGGTFATDGEACASCHTGGGDVDPMAKTLVLPGTKDAPGPVWFSHATHVLAAGSCSVCHAQAFAMKASSKPRATGAFHAKEACGACHDGRKAFSVDERCDSCHRTEGQR